MIGGHVAIFEFYENDSPISDKSPPPALIRFACALCFDLFFLFHFFWGSPFPTICSPPGYLSPLLLLMVAITGFAMNFLSLSTPRIASRQAPRWGRRWTTPCLRMSSDQKQVCLVVVVADVLLTLNGRTPTVEQVCGSALTERLAGLSTAE